MGLAQILATFGSRVAPRSHCPAIYAGTAFGARALDVAAIRKILQSKDAKVRLLQATQCRSPSPGEARTTATCGRQSCCPSCTDTCNVWLPRCAEKSLSSCPQRNDCFACDAGEVRCALTARNAESVLPSPPTRALATAVKAQFKTIALDTSAARAERRRRRGDRRRR